MHIGVAVHRIHFQHQHPGRLAGQRLLDTQPGGQGVLARLPAGKTRDPVLVVQINRRDPVIEIAVANHHDVQRIVRLAEIPGDYRPQRRILRLIIAGDEHHGTQLKQQQEN